MTKTYIPTFLRLVRHLVDYLRDHQRTMIGSLRLPMEAMAARAAWLVGELSQHEG